MKTLHEELTDIILKAFLKDHYHSIASKKNAHEAAGAVIEKIISVLPEEVTDNIGVVPTTDAFFAGCREGHNAVLDTLKDLLTEGKDSNDKT